METETPDAVGALRASFLDLYRREAPAVLRFVRIAGGGDVEDVCSEVFLRAWRAWPRFSGNQAQARAWLFTIARNLAADAHRRRGRLHIVAIDDTQEHQLKADADIAAQVAVRRVIGRLPKGDRELLALRAAGFSHEEIATTQSRQPGAVRVAYSRAARRLHQLLEER